MDKRTAVYPLVPEFDETYNAVIIVCETATDLAFIKTCLHIDKAQSYKKETTGETLVTTSANFIELWKEK